MDYDALVAKVIELLQREQRVPYRVLKRRFDLDDDDIADLKVDLIEAKRLASDEHDRILVWTGDTQQVASQPAQPPLPPPAQERQSTQVESLPPVSPAPEAERRQLTVMFCDLVDSTKLSTQWDPEDYREVVRAYQQVCSEVIQRYAGHVAQFLGDGLGDKNFKRHFRRAAPASTPAGGCCSCAAMAAPQHAAAACRSRWQ